MRTRLVLLATTLVLAHSGVTPCAFARPPGGACVRLLSPERVLRRAQFIHDRTQARLHATTKALPGEIRAVDFLGAPLGVLHYRIKGEVLAIEYLNVDERHRRRGLGRMLLARAVLEHPEVTVIEGELHGANFDEFRNAMALGLEPLDAIRRTPAYRMRRALGFGRIDLERTDFAGPKLATRR